MTFPLYVTGYYETSMSTYRAQLQQWYTLWEDICQDEDYDVTDMAREIGISSLRAVPVPPPIPRYTGEVSEEDKEYWKTVRKPDYAGEREYWERKIKNYKR